MSRDGTEQRKLAAIMFTDMVGYSALTQRNEKLALELLEEQRRLLRALFPQFAGREVETTAMVFWSSSPARSRQRGVPLKFSARSPPVTFPFRPRNKSSFVLAFMS